MKPNSSQTGSGLSQPNMKTFQVNAKIGLNKYTLTPYQTVAISDSIYFESNETIINYVTSNEPSDLIVIDPSMAEYPTTNIKFNIKALVYFNDSIPLDKVYNDSGFYVIKAEPLFSNGFPTVTCKVKVLPSKSFFFEKTKLKNILSNIKFLNLNVILGAILEVECDAYGIAGIPVSCNLKFFSENSSDIAAVFWKDYYTFGHSGKGYLGLTSTFNKTFEIDRKLNKIYQ